MQLRVHDRDEKGNNKRNNKRKVGIEHYENKLKY